MLTPGKTPITDLKGIGEKVAKKLQNLGIYSIEDVLFHLPSRYEDRTRIYPIRNLHPGIHATVEGTVERSDIKFGKARMLLVTISDQSGRIGLRFFHFSAAQKQQLIPGTRIRCFGEIRGSNMGLEIIHPEYKIIKDDAPLEVEDALTPIYPTTEGIKQLTLRNISEQALAWLNRGHLAELLPESFYQHQISLKEALNTVHRPPPDIALSLLEEGKHPAQKRLIIEELLAQNLSVLKVREQSNKTHSVAIQKSSRLVPQLLAQLPFKPTGAQQRVVNEISADLTLQRPMMRLVQGDVGSGKTLVAAISALHALEAGYQVALMAPTELLAEQHANNFRNWLEPLGVQVEWLAGKLTGKAKQAALDNIASGESKMIVGTHALFQKQVEFYNLALIIVDEQHRFGVHQRLALREKGAGPNADIYPHQLIMTATPIPRTLAMTAYADLDTSIIDELPPGRTPVTTVVIPDTRREEIIERVRQTCTKDNRQVYWVCTLIEESEVLQCEAAEDTCQVLQAALPELKVGLVHGRMKAAEKQEVMQQFKDNYLNLLVATTVIEVGVDVPNASLMIIENADRLGLAQLHQLRGRVGRGSVASHCVLMYQAPLSKTAQKRLGVLRDSSDGFVIAQKDLEIRGPGELLGTKQTGLADLKIADLIRDAELIPQIQQWAVQLWQQYPSYANAIIHRWLPYKDKYGHA
ncbi:ATP-dependent DNA helicase RecG [Paraneptunicella aestuarii]|uniref:ATP-dependent DNA helicase RecG n=1 Tax=Paraneptunicella aestuarii TaxID=2831148 RepID=UPI001E5FA29F|nr:ATP-dependent DNA helicase RecG [Paraneptunicella aestuarii]UAA38386.1 ATP-dependent DNA helicase RecG [Paraneptunicella aestuarii]